MPPIKPSEVQSAKAASLPEEVFEVFNALITREWSGRQAVVNQREAADAIASRLMIDRHTAYERHLLDVEGAYELAGWKVLYDRPAYNENYEPTFTFTKNGDGK